MAAPQSFAPIPAPPRRSRLGLWITVAVLAVALVGFGVFATISISQSHDDVSQLRREISQDRQLLSQEKTALHADESTIQSVQSDQTSLSDQIGALSKPNDPLSAYNQICNSQFTNGVTGLLQTYYYPCTNSVQTIPQPGA